MDRQALTELLISRAPSRRAATMARFPSLLDDELAHLLAERYRQAVNGNPRLAKGAAHALDILAKRHPTPVTRAYADWTTGLATLQIAGQPAEALALLDAATARFLLLNEQLIAAIIQIGKLSALILLGRYEETIMYGATIRERLRARGDRAGLCKVAQNLGNLHLRRGAYELAEQHYHEALELALATADPAMIACAEHGLANLMAIQQRPHQANLHYERAMTHATAAGATVTQAEITCSLGGLALSTGRYAEALDYLERSCHHYRTLNMPHELRRAELELAEAYLQLNMVAEATARYRQIYLVLTDLGLRSEQARACLGYGRACLLAGQTAQARLLSEQAHALYQAEGNRVGMAMATLNLAQIAYTDHDVAVAATLAATVSRDLEQLGAYSQLLLARWLHGEACRLLGNVVRAKQLLTKTLELATPDAPPIAQRCLTSLGLLELAQGKRVAAEAYFVRACELIEQLRAPLPAEEVRTAFVADKLTPFYELARICLNDRHSDRQAEALITVERARSRALLDMMRREFVSLSPPDPAVAELITQFELVRTEVSWFDQQIHRLTRYAHPDDQGRIGALQQAAREREQLLNRLGRQIVRQHAPARGEPDLDISLLSRQLGTDTVLVEYAYLDDELLAFLVDAEGVQVVRGLASAPQVSSAIAQSRFQLGTLRHGAQIKPTLLVQLTERMQHHLRLLYRLLMAPLEPLLGGRGLIIVPHRDLYYLPFHALHDGSSYLIERCEVTYAPSARVYQSVALRPEQPIERLLLVGVPDERTPRLQAEIDQLRGIFPATTVLLGDEATREALGRHGSSADLLHLACHGEFRQDSPLLSALVLGDGRLTVHDIYQLQLGGELAVLSACESGMSSVAPSDEIFGLVRGFFAAGVPALIVSLWEVDDGSTTRMMQRFYAALFAGAAPATALRSAQLAALSEQPHPFFWAPFTLVGRR